MRKFLFNFVFAFALGVFTTLWFVSPGKVEDFIKDVTKDGSLDLSTLQKKADWQGAEQKVISGAKKTVDAVSEWEMFNNIRARDFVDKDVK